MDKEKILERNRKGFSIEDERELFISNKANTVARIFFALICICLIVYKNYVKLNANDIWSILFIFYFVESIYKYHHLKKKGFLLTGVITFVLFIYCISSFIGLV